MFVSQHLEKIQNVRKVEHFNVSKQYRYIIYDIIYEGIVL